MITESDYNLTDSRFGQALHINLNHVIIGAPKAPNGGNVLECPLNNTQPCSTVFKKQKSFSQSGITFTLDESKTLKMQELTRYKDEYLGFSLTANNKGDIFACAPRYQHHLTCRKERRNNKSVQTFCQVSQKVGDANLMAGRCVVRRKQKPDDVTEGKRFNFF